MHRINLSFFGGGSSKETVKTHGEKSDYLKNMDAATYKFFQPIANKYGGLTMGDVTYGGGTSSSTGNSSVDSTIADNNLTGSSTGTSGVDWSNGTSWLDDPDNVMGQGFAQADKTYSQSLQNVNDLLSQSSDYIGKQASTTDEAADIIRNAATQTNDYLQNHQDLLANGTNSGLQNYMSQVGNAINNTFSTNAANVLNNAAARGIVNSTTSNKSLYDLEKTASNAVADQYADAFNTYLSNYLSGADTATNTANTNATNLLSAASGYGDLYKNALSGISTNQDAASNAYTTALSPVMSAYQYWRDLNTDYTNEDTEDTIVSSGK